MSAASTICLSQIGVARSSTRWAAYDVRFHRTGRKQLHHPVVSDVDLSYEAFELPAEPGLTMLVYTGSSTQARLHSRARLCHPGRPQPASQLGRQTRAVRRGRAGVRSPHHLTPQH
ncbi:hypothetical protein [Jatrophihabitans sp.]|uniref:MmyB family transcriptional regulator n=1 Tax=Jatrophihabitans sp. TaxID=1932789 RepID=UPI0038CD1251